jgi:hypothetical protein
LSLALVICAGVISIQLLAVTAASIWWLRGRRQHQTSLVCDPESLPVNKEEGLSELKIPVKKEAVKYETSTM